MVIDLRGLQTPLPSGVHPDVLRLVSSCTDDLMSRNEELVQVLHQRLFELLPGVSRQAGGGGPMCQRLVAAVMRAAAPELAVAHSAAVVQQVGADNHVEGFPADQYASVTHALLHAVRDVYRGEWSSSLSSAWVEYLLWYRSQLLAGAEAQRAYDAAQGLAPGAATPGAGDRAPSNPPAASADALFAGQGGGQPALPVGALLDDDLDHEDDDDQDEPGYGGLMSSMTLNSRRERRSR